MLTRKIIVILFSLTALGLSSCQGNRLNGSTSLSVATVAVDGPNENGPDAMMAVRNVRAVSFPAKLEAKSEDARKGQNDRIT